MKYVILFFVTQHTICLVYGANVSNTCDSKCYQSVNNSLKNLTDLIERFNSTSSTAKIPKLVNLDQIRKDIHELKLIEQETINGTNALYTSWRNVNRTDQNIAKNQKRVGDIFGKLSNISQFYNTSAEAKLQEAEQRLAEFEHLRDLAENASKTCRQAKSQYAELENIVNNVTQDFDNLTKKATVVNVDLSKTLRETVDIKESVQNIKLPLAVEINPDNTLNLLKNNSELLKELLAELHKEWDDKITQKIDRVMRNITELQGNIKDINEELKVHEQALDELSFTPTVDEESKKLLDELKKNISSLEKQLSSIDFSEEKKLLNKFLEEIKMNRLVLKEVNLLLDALPDEEELKYIKEQIEELRITVSLVAELNRLRNQLELLRKYEDEINKTNCSTFRVNNQGLS